MTTMTAANLHPVGLTRPFFCTGGAGAPGVSGAAGAGATLHRYQETEFIPRFLNDLAAGRLSDPARADWWQADRFSVHDDRLVLRLPIHRTFYLVACELVCDRLGHPALDPARIKSAGFVIRRIGGPAERVHSKSETRKRARATRAMSIKERLLGRTEAQIALQANEAEQSALAGLLGQTPGQSQGELAWIIEDGEPLGWQPLVPGGRDPDLGRRPCLNGVLRRGPAPLIYNGEETHPLHAVTARDSAGRLHTLLYGFLPLGGQALSRGSPFDAAAEREAVTAEQGRLTWPFGFAGRPNHSWQAADARQVSAGVPTAACFGLLEVLVHRYHLGESAARRTDPLNDGLAAAARGLSFIDESAPLVRSPDGTRWMHPVGFSLWDYLESCFAAGEDNPLPGWLAQERKRIDDAGGLSGAGALAALPARPLPPQHESVGTLRLSLLIAEADGPEWRTLLGERLLDQARRTGAELPIPKFRQEPDDLYQVVPFVRALDEQDRERLTWAPASARSEPFRVAAPFDPDASRPVLIQMPSLSDLKRGLAKGASMLIPPDTQGLLDALKLNQGVGPDLATEPPPPGSALGIQWICSFSLPVITLIAMILLMIMVILLNLVFFWLPWVRLCLPFPKLKQP